MRNIQQRLVLSSVIVASLSLPAAAAATERPAAGAPRPAPEFDIRDRRTLVAESPRAAQAARALRAKRPGVTVRYDGRRGVRTFHALSTGITGPDRRTAPVIARNFLASIDPALLDLDRDDIRTLRLRDRTKESGSSRVVYFDQFVDGVPVFNGAVAMQVEADGRIVKLLSTVTSVRSRLRGGIVGAEEAVHLAAGNVRADLDRYRPAAVEWERSPEQRTHMARGPLADEPIASLVYFPLDGHLRSAWRVTLQPEGTRAYDIVIDARTGRILFRRGIVTGDSDGVKALDLP
jgi:hypothetical protein